MSEIVYIFSFCYNETRLQGGSYESYYSLSKTYQTTILPKLPLLVDGKIAGTVTQGKILSLPITQPSVTLSIRGDKNRAFKLRRAIGSK